MGGDSTRPLRTSRAPYDVVLDCNRNGLLDAGDFADGRTDGAGLYVVPDSAAPGPLEVTTRHYGTGSFTQVAYHPRDLESLGQLPLVVVSHGWTHSYLWYDHIGQHLASWGYVVMSHVNDVGGGGPANTDTAAVATLQNIEFLLGGPAGTEAFIGHIDPHRIVLIGHSTGGESVVRAYTRLRTGSSFPLHFGVNDIVLLAPIAPVAWLNATNVNPFDLPFHMFGGAADTDTSNGPVDSFQQLLLIYERATGPKQVTYLHGAGHADFHNGTPPSEDWASGPDLIGRAGTHPILLGYLLPLVELHAKGNPVGREWFVRMDDTFRLDTGGTPVVLAQEQRDAAAQLNFVIEDFESHPEIDRSSSGGEVRSSASNLAEIVMRDVDGAFTWTGAQAANGLTRARPTELRHAVTFDWSPEVPAYYELDVIPTQRDFSDDGYLSFRAAQGTLHPETVALAGPLSFTVTLRDGLGVETSVSTASWGSFTQPHQHTGAGTGAGWATEFSTMRIPLDGFGRDAGSVDLSHIVAVRFDFGVSMAPEVYDHICFDAGDSAGNGPFEAHDTEAGPADHAGWYYLVSTVTATGEGPLGAASIDLSPDPGVQLQISQTLPCP